VACADPATLYTTPVRIPLCISDAAIMALPKLKLSDLSANDPLLVTHHSQLHKAQRPVHQLLGIDSALEGASQHIVGFDVEWRPTFGRSEGGAIIKRVGQVSPASVLQLSSTTRVVVINLLALGMSIQGETSPGRACAAGLPLVMSFFGDSAVCKVGLQCAEDLARLKELCPSLRFENTVDVQV
jgi:hypothetical protein